jgi:hypothetical protein
MHQDPDPAVFRGDRGGLARAVHRRERRGRLAGIDRFRDGGQRDARRHAGGGQQPHAVAAGRGTEIEAQVQGAEDRRRGGQRGEENQRQQHRVAAAASLGLIMAMAIS